MGRTVRQSKSPYATANRRQSAHKQTPAGDTVLYQRRQQNQSAGTLTPEMELVASSVTERIIPELQGQIVQAIQSMQKSPANSSTPDSVDQSSLDTGINATNTNLQNMVGANISPVNSFNDDLGMHVSQQVRDKIINGEYVELDSLLNNSNNDQTKTIVVDNNGNINVKQKPEKRITEIGTWVDAFLIYTSIYTAAHPDSTQGLLKYMFNVKLGASRCIHMGWKKYDQQFRLKRARNPTMAWGTVDMELWLLYISQGQTPVSDNQVAVGKCFTYNNKGRCGRTSCRYLHRCLKCGGPHAAFACTLLKTNYNYQVERKSGKFPDGNFRGNFQKEGYGQTSGFRFRSAKHTAARAANSVEGSRQYAD